MSCLGHIEQSIFLIGGRFFFSLFRVFVRAEGGTCFLHFLGRVFEVLGSDRGKALDFFSNLVGGIHDLGLLGFSFGGFFLIFDSFGLGNRCLLFIHGSIQITNGLAQGLGRIHGEREQAGNLTQLIARLLFISGGTQEFATL